MRNLIKRFAKEDCGATSIEYGLIASLIGIAIIVSVTSLSSQVGTTFTNASKGMAKK